MKKIHFAFEKIGLFLPEEVGKHAKEGKNEIVISVWFVTKRKRVKALEKYTKA